MDSAHQIAICIASHNRREKTLACLRSLASAELPDGLGYRVYLLEDGSTDGTVEAVAAEFPDTCVLHGSGNDFWAGGMRKAFGEALKHPHPWFVWMNDDVAAYPDALARLIRTEQQLGRETGMRHIVSGGMVDPATGRTSYGAFSLPDRRNPSRFDMVEPDPDRAVSCDLVNANMLLIPGEVARAVGNIPAGYTHTLADWDLGLRAKRAGFDTALAPGYAGECTGNVPLRRTWYGPGLSLRERFRRMTATRALPFIPRARYLFTHFPLTAPLYLFGPYFKMPLQHWTGALDRPVGDQPPPSAG